MSTDDTTDDDAVDEIGLDIEDQIVSAVDEIADEIEDQLAISTLRWARHLGISQQELVDRVANEIKARL